MYCNYESLFVRLQYNHNLAFIIMYLHNKDGMCIRLEYTHNLILALYFHNKKGYNSNGTTLSCVGVYWNCVESLVQYNLDYTPALQQRRPVKSVI